MTWPTNASRRSASRSMRARSGCDCAPARRSASASAMRMRASGERSSCETSRSSVSFAETKAWMRSAIASKSRASVPTSSRRRVNGAPTRVSRAPAASARLAFCKPHDRRRHVASEQQRYDGRRDDRDREHRDLRAGPHQDAEDRDGRALRTAGRYSSPLRIRDRRRQLHGREVRRPVGPTARRRGCAASARSSRGIARPSSSSPRSFVTSSTMPGAGRGFSNSQALSSRSPPRASAADTSLMISVASLELGLRQRPTHDAGTSRRSRRPT